MIGEVDMVDDLEEQSSHPQPDTESGDEGTSSLHSECENQE